VSKRSGLVRSLVIAVTAVIAVALCAGCEKDELSDRDVRSVCMNLGAGGWQSAMWAARAAGMTDDAKAAAAVRKAAHDTCPAYAHRLA
jgi:hypothetical protein